MALSESTKPLVPFKYLSYITDLALKLKISLNRTFVRDSSFFFRKSHERPSRVLLLTSPRL